MLVRRERPEDHVAVRSIVVAAFAKAAAAEPGEAALLDRLRTSAEWLPELSLVAARDGLPIGHVVCSRAFVGAHPVLALGPLAVAPATQGEGVGSALMHAALGAADAHGEPLVVLLGNPGYYQRFGFQPAAALGIGSPDPGWGDALQARILSTYRRDLRGGFRFAPAFDGM